jgi:nucleotide-binding universal stress UspA family protein
MLSNILVAFDGSEHSFQAARFAAETARLIPGSQCTLITVLTFTREDARFLGASSEEFEKAEKSLEAKIFGDIIKFFNDANVPLITVYREGDPAMEIIKYAEAYFIDHIVIGSRGLGNIKGTLLGSVSSKVIYNSKCPVTIIKDKIHIVPESAK